MIRSIIDPSRLERIEFSNDEIARYFITVKLLFFSDRLERFVQLMATEGYRPVKSYEVGWKVYLRGDLAP